MARIISPNGSPAIAALAGASYYRFSGIEITFVPFPGASDVSYDLVALAPYPQVYSNIPHHIFLDRCYIHSYADQRAKRGVSLNGAFEAIIDSYISEFHNGGQDTQAILGWNGPGPYKIVNNYLEGASENIMFGGATPDSLTNVPSDIEIRGNYFFKPLAWRMSDPSYNGHEWVIKNLFECKNAQRVLLEGNLFENSWPYLPGGQRGFAILLTPRFEAGAAPQAVCNDFTIRNNRISKSFAGIAISGTDDGDAANVRRSSRVSIYNNSFELDTAMGPSDQGPNGHFIQLGYGPSDV